MLQDVKAVDPWDDLATQAPHHFEELHTGKEALPPTPLFKNLGWSPEKALAEWLKVLEHYASQYPQTITYDKSRTKKFGKRGGYPSWEVMKEVLPLYSTRLKRINFTDPLIQGAIEATQRKLKLDKKLHKRPLSLDTAIRRIVEDMEASFKVSGVASYGNKKDPEVIRRAREMALHPNIALGLPFTIAERTQRINREKKSGGTRFIFEIAYATEMLQKRFFYPLFDYIRSLRLPELAAYEGFSDVEDNAFEPCASGEEFSSNDFTGMDQTCGPDQTEFFYEVTKNFFQESEWPMYKAVLMAGVTNPVMIEYTKAWAPHSHGTASGESFTSIKETVCNMGGHELCILMMNQDHEYQVDGDDSVSKGRNLIQPLSTAFAMLGFELNPEKQDVSATSYHYLQRFFCPEELGKKGAYPTVLALNACIYPERFHNPKLWSARMETLRWIMVLENCCHHPAFHDLIDFVRKGDKYGLDLGPNPEALYAKAKAISGFIPSYNQANKNRKISDFEVVKYLQGRE